MEHEIRKSVEQFTARIRTAIDGELDSLAAELMQAADAAQKRARAEAEAAMTAREAVVRLEVESQLSRRIDEARTAAAAEARASALAEAQQLTAREAARVEATTAAAQAAERDARLAAVERLAASVRRIDAAASLRDTLESLAESAALETPRVAVLLIEGNDVRAFSHRGFDEVPAFGPIAAGGVIEACVQHGQPAFTSDAAGLRAPGFAGLADDRAGFAVPLRVGNRTVAVLYADDAAGAEHDAPAAWPEALELLARHASIHLENLTAMRAVQGVTGTAGAAAPSPEDDDAARRYARLLVAEIKLYNEPAVKLGRERRDLGSRLRDEIARARRTYLERIPASVASRDRYFETELVQTLAGGDPSILQ